MKKTVGVSQKPKPKSKQPVVVANEVVPANTSVKPNASQKSQKFTITYTKRPVPILTEVAGIWKPECPVDEFFKYNPFHIDRLQHFYPIMEDFFELTAKNVNVTTFATTTAIEQASDLLRDNVFVKYAPLIDPFSYVNGVFHTDDVVDTDTVGIVDGVDPCIDINADINAELKLIPTLPVLRSNEAAIPGVYPGILSKHNFAYVDTFFSMLCGHMRNHHEFIHAVDFYGSFLGIQTKFKLNVWPELDDLIKNPWFNEHAKSGTAFEVALPESMCAMNSDGRYMLSVSRKQKPRIICESLDDADADGTAAAIAAAAAAAAVDECTIVSVIDVEKREEEEEEGGGGVVEVLEITGLIENMNLDSIQKYPMASSSDNDDVNDELSLYTDMNDNVYTYDSEENISESTDDDDGCTSTQDPDNNSMSTGECSCGKSDCSECADDGFEPEMNAYLPNFPVQMVCLERCDATFHDLLLYNELDDVSITSAMMQIIMILITYQKCFRFTHNDLHTKNIMYTETSDIKFLVYRLGDDVYKVPTHGRIYKIIDFGRSIFDFNGQRYCSSSFELGGDAYGQYNCEPFYDEKLPRVDPSFAFDLTRLASSVYDFILDISYPVSEMSVFQQFIHELCLDDRGRNILYKSNGTPRYNGFKMYSMLVRYSTHQTPVAQLSRPLFQQFKLSPQSQVKQMQKLKKSSASIVVVDINALPEYF